MNEKTHTPKAINIHEVSSFLIVVFLLVFGFYIASDFLIPFTYAALLSMLMLPACRRMEKSGLSRSTSSFLCILFIVLGVAVLIFMMSSQLISISGDLPALQQQLSAKLDGLQAFIQQKTSLSPERQILIIKSKSESFLSTAGNYFTSIFFTTTSALGTFLLIIIYIFFFLFYRLRIFSFIISIMPGKSHETTLKTLNEITKVTTAYITGLLIVIVLLAAMNFIGFAIIGVPHALFFALLIALLNTIPYIGVWIGSIFPVLLMVITKNSVGPVFATIAVIAAVQFIEGNFLTPTIVGSRVKINAMAAIIAIILGGILWGTSGMILFIPLLGICKVVFDNVERLAPYAYLIGDDIPTVRKISIFKKLKKKINSLFSK
jgi:predicted PurR-regulated permease PerM